jgi:WD40 repeat protein
MAFGSNGSILAAAGDDGTVILWDLAEPERPDRLEEPLTGQAGEVWSVVFAPDGRTLATVGTQDGIVILWDVSEGDRPARVGEPLTGDTGRVWSVAFASDGQTLVTGGLDGTVTLWDLERFNQTRDHLLERACDLTGGGLSRDEWTRHVPGLPYEETCARG